MSNSGLIVPAMFFAIWISAAVLQIWFHLGGRYLEQVKTKFILPALEKRKFTFLRVERIEGLFVGFFNGDKGDFEDGSFANVVESLSKHRPRYKYLFYLDTEHVEHRCTIKIWGGFLKVKMVKFQPQP